MGRKAEETAEMTRLIEAAKAAPCDDPVTITLDFIERGGTAGMGFNRQQALILGIDWPLTSGWKQRAIGRVISRQLADLYYELQGTKRADRKGIIRVVEDGHKATPR